MSDLTKATLDEPSLYDFEKRLVEEDIADRPDHCVTDGDWRDVEDPHLKLELLARYIRQEHLWNSPDSDHRSTFVISFPKATLRKMVEAMEAVLNA
jgi:hypothetical protein